MCGIAGVVASPGGRPDVDALERMVAALAHRGPDDRGLEVVGSVGLGHTRLAIVDPSPAGHQPMASPSGRWWVTYNGEVFNHAELRAELDGAFRGGSDTETLVSALDRWDEEAIPRCNGLFAYAALDVRRRRLLLVRDRFGVKPLYLARHAGAVWFASEISSLLAAGIPRRPRVDVLAHAISHGWAADAAPPLEGVDAVPPGTVVSVDLDTLEVTQRSWYRPAQVVDAERAAALARLDRRSLADEVERALRTSVRRRLMADVPVGTMCSGGIDSSLITALAREDQPSIRAYNASVEDQPAVDESPWASAVTRSLGIELRTVAVSGSSWRAGLVSAVRHNELPLLQENSVAMAQIAALARADGVKVLLSGEGADELYAGYDYLHRAEYRAFAPRSARVRQRVRLTRGRLDALRRRRGVALLAGPRARVERLRSRARPTTILDALGSSPIAVRHSRLARERAVAAYVHHQGARAALEAGLLADLSTYLPHLLNRQDKNTMQHSIETRVPYLDPDLVALTVNLPLEARSLPHRKGVLRELARRHLPAVISTRTKVGFSFDVRRYLLPAARPEFVVDGRLRELLELPRDEFKEAVGATDARRLLRLWTAEVWCRLMLDGDSVTKIEGDLWAGGP